MCSKTDIKKKLSNLVSVAGTSNAVSRNEIRGGDEKVMKRGERKKRGYWKHREMSPRTRKAELAIVETECRFQALSCLCVLKSSRRKAAQT